MKNKQIIFCFSDNDDLLEISNNMKNSFYINLKMNYIQLIKIILENNNKNKYIVTENSIKGELFALSSKILNKKTEYSIWIDEIKELSFKENILELISVYYSKSLITRTKQMRFQLSKSYKKRVFVIYPWLKEKFYQKKEFSYNIYTNTKLKMPKSWKTTNSLENADVSIIKLENKLLLFKLPLIIIKSIEERIPTVIIYHKPRTVNKIFKYVKNIYVVKAESDLDFNDLEYFAHQSYKFKIPKKLRFKYNLSNFKKILK